jgi:glutamate--cysteine ligase
MTATVEGALRRLDRILIDEAAAVEDTLGYHRNQVRCPVYTSVDVRRNRCKAAVVDANAYPAGFNNLAKRSHAQAAQTIQNYMGKMYPGSESVLLLGESHTRNSWYFQNLKALGGMFEAAGLSVTMGTMAEELGQRADVETALGDTITLHQVVRDGDQLTVDGKAPDVVILNNDLSTGTPELLHGVSQPITPPPIMGWHHRSKSEHFRIVRELAESLGDDVGFDPWLITAEFESVDDVDFKSRQNLDGVAKSIDQVIARVQTKYDEYDIDSHPAVFVKADSGTYGMGITTATSGEEFLHLNSKARDKMHRGKERQTTSRVIVQEGVPTEITHGDAGAAEPVLYMVCGKVIGGFYRVHDSKGITENLNSPGSRFVPFLTQSDGVPGPDETQLDPITSHVYQVLGEIASIATGYELKFSDSPGSALPQYP